MNFQKAIRAISCTYSYHHYVPTKSVQSFGNSEPVWVFAAIEKAKIGSINWELWYPHPGIVVRFQQKIKSSTQSVVFQENGDYCVISLISYLSQAVGLQLATPCLLVHCATLLQYH